MKARHFLLPLRLYLTISLVVLLALRIAAGWNIDEAVQLDIGERKATVNALTLGGGRVGLKDGVFYCEGLPAWLCRRFQRRLDVDAKALLAQLPQLGERVVANLGAAMFVMLPAFALWLKLLYLNRRLRYTEHLVFALHVHAFWFLALACTVFGPAWAGTLATFVVPAYTLLAMRRVYGGRWWPLLLRARQGWAHLKTLLETTPDAAAPTPLPRPAAALDVNQITVFPPDQQKASLRMVDFHLRPGEALGVIGPSASGKSTLARVLTGVWRPASGAVRLDGAALDQYDADVLGRYIGYLPQDVVLFDATVAENIARLDASPDAEAVVTAAKRAGAHEMVLQLPQGYDTPVSAGGARLSGGQKQRIGLARAFYGDPVLLVLDEPNSNLDAAGQDALNLAIRQAKADGKAVIIMAHRPAGIAECDKILIIDGGVVKAFGPRDEVLKAHVRNYAAVAGRIAPEAQG